MEKEPNVGLSSLEGLRKALDMKLDNPNISSYLRETIRRHLIAAKREACIDTGVGEEASRMITEYYK